MSFASTLANTLPLDETSICAAGFSVFDLSGYPGDLRHSPNCQHTVFCAFREDADGEITDGPHKGKFYKNPLVIHPVTKEIIGPDDVGLIDTLEHGQQDLDRQLQLIAARMITVDPVTHLPVTPRKPTVRDCIYTWAPLSSIRLLPELRSQ